MKVEKGKQKTSAAIKFIFIIFWLLFLNWILFRHLDEISFAYFCYRNTHWQKQYKVERMIDRKRAFSNDFLISIVRVKWTRLMKHSSFTKFAIEIFQTKITLLSVSLLCMCACILFAYSNLNWSTLTSREWKKSMWSSQWSISIKFVIHIDLISTDYFRWRRMNTRKKARKAERCQWMLCCFDAVIEDFFFLFFFI